MQDHSSEHLPVEPSGDIPWGQVIESAVIPGRGWWAPQGNLIEVYHYLQAQYRSGQLPNQAELKRLADPRLMCLERVTLGNGLRYAVIRDAESGAEAYNCYELCDWILSGYDPKHPSPLTRETSAIKGVDLGKGYTLTSMMAAKPNSMEVGYSASFVDKVVSTTDVASGQSGSHKIHFQVKPSHRHFVGRYDYGNVSENCSIWMRAPKDDTSMAHPRGLEYKINTKKMSTGDQINFIFDSSGRLVQMRHGSRDLLGVEGAGTEMLALTERAQRGIVVLEGQQLLSPRARLAVQRLLGVIYGATLTLDTKTTLQNLIQNVDGPQPKNPSQVLAFKDATPEPQW